jgi:hypothetical protein
MADAEFVTDRGELAAPIAATIVSDLTPTPRVGRRSAGRGFDNKASAKPAASVVSAEHLLASMGPY